MSAVKPFLFHGQTHEWIEQQGHHLVIRFLCHDPEHLVDACFVRCEPDNEDRLIECEPIEINFIAEVGTLFQATIPLSTHIETTYYVIKCLINKTQLWLSAAGLSARIPGRENHFKYNAKNQPPKWVKSQIFYQIFPDRFYQGNKSLSVQTGEYLYQGGEHAIIAKEWGRPVAKAGHDSTGASEFYGGDLKGIQSKLDYLQSLGISALYLNPIFTSPSNHKYDTTDYMNVDPHLGGNQQFAKLTKDLHSRGMKIILDAVFNHTSCEHKWFGRYQASSEGAYGNLHSPYRDYYIFSKGDSKNYINWNGIDTLPKLNFLNDAVQNYLYKAEDSVLKYWLKPPYNIDGWRFDVIHMLGESSGAYNNTHYVKAFRASAKAVNKEAYIVGEHFYEATQWLQGDQEDGAMNYYGFAHPVRAFFANLDIAFHAIEIDAQEFDLWLAESRSKIPWLNQLAQLNQLDSHDTMRFINQLNGDIGKLKAASMMLFSYPGTPCLYYGTEVALQGGHDPDNRRCFPWSTLDKKAEIFIFYQQLIEFRKVRKELQEGSYQTLFTYNKCFAFARHFQQKTTIYAVNLDQNEQQITFDTIALLSQSKLFVGFDSTGKSWRVEMLSTPITLTLSSGTAVLLYNE